MPSKGVFEARLDDEIEVARKMEGSRLRVGWSIRDSITISAFSFGSTAFAMALGVLVLPLLVLRVGPEEMKNTLLGIMGLAGLAVAMAVQPLTGRMSDRTTSLCGRRAPYIMVGGVAASIGVFLLPVAAGPVALTLALMAVQLCLNIALGPYYALIRDLAPKARRGATSSVKLMADAGGAVVSLVMLAFLLGNYAASQQVVWLWLSLGFISLVLTVSMLWTATGVRRMGTTDPSTPRAPEEKANLRRTQAGFGWFLGSRFCTFAALGVLQTYAVFFLRDVAGLANPVRTAGLMAAVIGVCVMVVAYPLGRLSDRVGRKGIVTVAIVVGAGGTLALLLARDIPPVLLLGALLGASAGAFFSVSWAMATDMVSAGRTAEHMGIANAAAVGGTALAKMAGPVIDVLNRLGEGLGYSVLLVACSLLFLLGALLLVPVRSERGAASAEAYPNS